MTISLCMIVKNESEVIERCLKSIQGCFDEIVIVDTGSSDNTKDICKKYTDRIYDFEWIDDFSAARNYAFSKAKSEYLFWLDADDVVYPQDKSKIIELKKREPSFDTYFMKYIAAESENGESIFEFYRERLVKNCKYAHFRGFIHECIVPFGRIGYSDIAIRHKKVTFSNPNRNIQIFEKNFKNGAIADTRMTYYYGKELFYINDYEKCNKTLSEYLLMQNKNIADLRDALITLYKCSIATLTPKNEYLFSALKECGGESEVLTLIGQYYKSINDHVKAEQYFKFALCINEKSTNGFINKNYYYLNPLLELLTLYFYQNKQDEAAKIHFYLKKHYPKNKIVLYNDKFFT